MECSYLQSRLGKMTLTEFNALYDAWREYTLHPRDYEGTVVEDMVKLWLKNYRSR